MEINNRKPVIVEFNGLPGSGKTTIAREVKKELEKEGKKVVLQFFKAKWDKNCYSMILYPSYWRLVFGMYRYSRSYQAGGNLYRSLLLASFVRMYREFVKMGKDDFLLLDQAVIQLFISVAHQNEFLCTQELECLLKLIKFNEMPIVIVNCNVKENVSNQRIEKRSLNGSRVESMSFQERYHTLEVQTSNFNIIREEVRRIYPDVLCINMDTSLPLNESVEFIMGNLASLNS